MIRMVVKSLLFMIPLLLLALVYPTFASQSPISMTMRKMYVATAESEKQAEYLDRLYAALKLRVDAHPLFHFIPIETIQQEAQQVLLPDWRE
ncbi:MAG: hypothetical protein EHM72_15170, partial [Calditrichaeota bacterium]